MLKERHEDYYYSSCKQKPLQSAVGHVIWNKPKIKIDYAETEMIWKTEMFKSKIKIMLASERGHAKRTFVLQVGGGEGP